MADRDLRRANARRPPTWIVKLCSFDQPNDSFRDYAVCIEEMNSRSEGCCSGLVERNKWDMTYITNKPIPKLHKAPQPPLPHPGATPDSDRAKKPPLVEPSATGQELNPGDRVEGLGDFGMPTGEFGTVQQTNEDDAVVKWDDNGRMRVHQPSLKKV
jgi:hypothetical protein